MGFLASLAYIQPFQIIILGGLIVGVFYFTAYDDGTMWRQEIADVQDQVKKKEEEVAKVKAEIERVKLFEQEVSNHKKVIKFFLNYIPASLTFNEISSLVNKQALSSGINIESKEDNQFGNRGEKAEYDILNLKLRVSGSFSQIMFFLSKLTAQKRLLVIDKIDLNILPGEKQIMSNINLLAYRYRDTEELTEEQGKQQ